MEYKQFLKQILQDKEGNYNLREAVTLLFVVITIISWVAEQFFGLKVPEYMFYSFVSLIGAGCFGYSLERRTRSINSTEKEQ
jgi:choline-glycine betaine transporter